MDKVTLNFYQFPLANRLNLVQRNSLKLKMHGVKNVVLLRFYPNAVQVFIRVMSIKRQFAELWAII